MKGLIFDKKNEITTNDTNPGVALLRENLFIIGSEAIFETDTPGTQNTGDSQYLLYNAIADTDVDLHGLPPVNRPATEHDWHLLLRRYGLENSSRCIDAWQRLGDLGKYVSEDLYEFLRLGIRKNIIKTIATTAIDDTLENVIRHIMEDPQNRIDKPLHIYNMGSVDQATGFFKADEEKQVSLVYLFGKMGDVEKDPGRRTIPFDLTEENQMDRIAEYIKKDTGILKESMHHTFYNRRIMAIGCRFDDWKFRFFWYAIRGSSYHENTHGKDNQIQPYANGTVAFSCYNADSDPLFSYLRSIDGLHIENNSRAFMRRLTAYMQSGEFCDAIIKKRISQAHGVFISYSSDDIVRVYDLFRYLSDQCGFPTWMDIPRLNPGDTYTDVIEREIKQCDVFVVVLGSRAKRDLQVVKNLDAFIEGLKQNPPLGPWYMKEWLMARKNAVPCIVPVILGEYDDPTEAYHTKFRTIIGLDGDRDATVSSIAERNRIAERIRQSFNK